MPQNHAASQVRVSVFVVTLVGPAVVARVWSFATAQRAVRRHAAEWCRVDDDGNATLLPAAPDALDCPWFGILLHRDPGGFTPEAYRRHALLRDYPVPDAFQSAVWEAKQIIAEALRAAQPGAVSFHDRTGRR